MVVSDQHHPLLLHHHHHPPLPLSSSSSSSSPSPHHHHHQFGPAVSGPASGCNTGGSMAVVNVNLNNMINAKDSRWLQLEVCREFQRSKCSRSDTECKFAHPPANVEVQNGRVIACYDSIKVNFILFIYIIVCILANNIIQSIVTVCSDHFLLLTFP